MNRVALISRRIALEESIFQSAFSKARQKAKDFKSVQEQIAANGVKKQLELDLSNGGFEVVSVDIALGRYRGSRYISSAKVRLKTDEDGSNRALQILKSYHPKYNLKSFDKETLIAEYNIR